MIRTHRRIVLKALFPAGLMAILLLGFAARSQARQERPRSGEAAKPVAPEAQRAVDDRIARIQRGLLPTAQVRGRTYEPATIQQRMAELKVPAVSLAVINDGRVEWAKAWGVADVESGRPATAETLFQAASISKPVAATAALRLVEQGKLTLDEPVNDKLTTWKILDNEHTAKMPVTLRHLLSHTAGTTVHGFPGYAAEKPVPTVQQVLDGQPPANTQAVRVDLVPGTRWRYSGGGYTIVQQLVSDVTGEPFDAVMRRLVLEPAGMAHSTYAQPLPTELANRAAVGYDTRGVAIPGRYHTYPEQAAAGLWTTPTDLARWVLAIQAALAGEEGALLSQSMAKQMMEPGQGDFGLGVQLEGDEPGERRFSHGGSNEGFRCYATGFIDGPRRGVVLMVNGDAGAVLGSELLQAVAREYGWPGFETREIVPVAIDPAKLAEYAGTYAVGGSPARVRVVVEGGRIEMIVPGGPEPLELIPTGEDAFAVALNGMPARFVRDGEGKVVTLQTAGREARRVEGEAE